MVVDSEHREETKNVVWDENTQHKVCDAFACWRGAWPCRKKITSLALSCIHANSNKSIRGRKELNASTRWSNRRRKQIQEETGRSFHSISPRYFLLFPLFFVNNLPVLPFIPANPPRKNETPAPLTCPVTGQETEVTLECVCVNRVCESVCTSCTYAPPVVLI